MATIFLRPIPWQPYPPTTSAALFSSAAKAIWPNLNSQNNSAFLHLMMHLAFHPRVLIRRKDILWWTISCTTPTWIPHWQTVLLQPPQPHPSATPTMWRPQHLNRIHSLAPNQQPPQQWSPAINTLHILQPSNYQTMRAFLLKTILHATTQSPHFPHHEPTPKCIITLCHICVPIGTSTFVICTPPPLNLDLSGTTEFGTICRTMAYSSTIQYPTNHSADQPIRLLPQQPTQPNATIPKSQQPIYQSYPGNRTFLFWLSTYTMLAGLDPHGLHLPTSFYAYF